MLHTQTLEEWGTAIVTAIGAVLLLGAVWKWLSKDSNSNPPSIEYQSNTNDDKLDNSLCNSPSCVRCRDLGGNLSSLKEKLLRRCYDYAVSVFHVSTDEAHQYMVEHYSRVMGMISSIESKEDILRNVHRESGYKTELAQSHPHIWMMPGLNRVPFWSVKEDHVLSQTIGSVFENSETLDIIQKEYLNVGSQDKGWKVNSIPAGRWRVYPLYNQGSKIEENCSQCPRTVEAVESLTNFMQCVYGNAMFSVLEVGSYIEPHTGSCNYRLRCHLPLIAPDGWTIQVGSECRSWKKGELMVFDDSHVHTVRYEDSSHSGSTGQNESRVLLIFDIWHPDVEESEQNILARIFRPL